MKKILLIVLLMLNAFSTQANEPALSKESGLNLDIARHFYDVDSLKSFIDTIHQAGGHFLQLHLSDDQNYALESAYLDQLERNATCRNGTCVNPKTGKPFLTYRQIDEIIRYAAEKQVELVPEVDSPGHMTAILSLLELKNGKDYVNGLRLKGSRGELNMTNPEAAEMVKTLIGEVIYIFGNSSRHFHAGGDEFSYDEPNDNDFIRYINELNDYISRKGLITRIWNDGLTKKNLDSLNKNIEITYWSYDGDTQDSQEAKFRRDIRADVPLLLTKGFRVLNYNSYYLYVVPRKDKNLMEDMRFARRDMQSHWQLGVWDKQNKRDVVANRQLSGAALSIWGEYADDMSGEQIQSATQDLLKIIIEKTNNAD
ncbi:family 20 glycosylhydrolase [Pasteurellaceae bacterium LIM206]|nr:family 20 glycosylhydrolase [Pasteurellaceae bacterium LIM206]